MSFDIMARGKNLDERDNLQVNGKFISDTSGKKVKFTGK